MSVFIGYPSFMAYQMMKGKKGNNDGFPSIPGMIARYSASGLTNEQMAANPVWVDKTGNGRDLQLKNFSWRRMSGVGGYVQDFNDFKNNDTVGKIRIDEQGSNFIKVTILTKGIGNAIYIPKNIYQFNKSYFIKISSEGYDEGDMALSFYAPSTSTATTVTVSLNPNGITEIPAIKEDDFLAVYLNVGGKVGSITIEQLPLYPGFILGDGVDDFAVTEKELNFEDTYTVYTAFIPFQDDHIKNMIVCGKDYKKDFYINYGTQLVFYTANSTKSIPLHINQFVVLLCKRDKTTGVIKNLVTGESFQFSVSQLISNPGLYYLWKSATVFSYGKTAIAGQTICNGYFSTDEDDENILNWHKKQYPWLFPDQAWTVTGKTNEDKDRATIANITCNGNDLVLSNFGFAEGSGYGSYFWNFKSFHDWNTVSEVINSKIVLKGSTSTFWGSQIEKIIGEELHIVAKVKVTGLTDEMPKLYFGKFDTGDKLQLTNGINNINKIIFAQYGWYGFGFEEAFESCNVTIEQIPEYEGYLVTDGVDDKIDSSAFKMGEDFTVVGEWKLLPVSSLSYSGMLKNDNLYLYNNASTGLRVYIRSTDARNDMEGLKSLKAICSDGRVYGEDWTEYKLSIGSTIGSQSSLYLGYNNTAYTKMIFKNLGIYNNQILSKEDCIKAYNYLQTLKAK